MEIDIRTSFRKIHLVLDRIEGREFFVRYSKYCHQYGGPSIKELLHAVIKLLPNLKIPPILPENSLPSEPQVEHQTQDQEDVRTRVMLRLNELKEREIVNIVISTEARRLRSY